MRIPPLIPSPSDFQQEPEPGVNASRDQQPCAEKRDLEGPVAKKAKSEGKQKSNEDSDERKQEAFLLPLASIHHQIYCFPQRNRDRAPSRVRVVSQSYGCLRSPVVSCLTRRFRALRQSTVV